MRPSEDECQDLGDPVEALLADVLGRSHAEQALHLQAACRERPDLADDLRQRFAALGEMGLLGTVTEASTRLEGPPGFLLGDEGVPEFLGEFRLKDRLGGGGMGVVYRAYQPDLDRDVALKLIRPELLYFPGARERFRREARAIAQLQHPGIVPLHSVGEEHGIPFFTMELIPGCTMGQLKRRLDGLGADARSGRDVERVVNEESDDRAEGVTDLPSPAFAGSRQMVVLGLVRQVALALEHAHARDVLHRDVKPSNIMVTPTGRAMLFDFGLALSDGTSRLTRSGSALGSLPYMSPEQCHGDALDERTDIYSLGVTLYELLAGENPFLRTDASETRSQILEGRPPSLRPHVSWDVETVCLTAMNEDRERRYASASAFADDLLAAIEGRPIRARRPGLLRRVTGRVRRNPMATTAICLALLLFLVAPWAFWYREQQNRRELGRLLEVSKRNEQVAREQRAWALNNLRVGSEAVDTFLTKVADDVLFEQPRMAPVRAELLEIALRSSERFLAHATDDPELKLEVALALARKGRIQSRMGELEASRTSFERSIAMLSELADGAPRSEAARSLALTLMLYGSELNAAMMPREAVHRLERAEELFLGMRPFSDRRGPQARAENARNLVSAYRTLGLIDAAEEPLAIATAWAATIPDDVDDVEELDTAADIDASEGLLLAARNDPKAEIPLRRAVERFDRALERHPTSIARLRAAAQARLILGRELYALGKLEDARPIFEDVVERLRQLTFLSPEIPRFRVTLARAIAQRAPLRNSAADARKDHEEALALLRELHEQNPSDSGITDDLANAYRHAGVFETQRRERDAALRQFREAVMLRRALLESAPDDPARAAELGADLTNLGSTLLGGGSPGDALTAAEEAVRYLTRVPDDLNGADHYVRYHWSALLLELMCLVRLDAFEEAIDRAGVMTALEAPRWVPYHGAAKQVGLILHRLSRDGAPNAALTKTGADIAIAALEKAVARGYGNEDELRRAPWFKVLADHPRFAAVLESAARARR